MRDVLEAPMVLGCERCNLGYKVNRFVLVGQKRGVWHRPLGLCLECTDLGGEG